MANRLLLPFSVLIGVMLAILLRISALSPGTRLDWAAGEGENYGRARFRLWFPDGANTIQAVVVLMPGSNEDGRTQVEEWRWQDFAARHDLALLGCNFADKPHPQMFIEAYAHAAQGSGQALLDALTAFGSRLDRPELGAVPLLLWGMSAGGEFNFEFVAWRPDRVAGFVVNKGGFYYSALLSPKARQVPGLLFMGGKDLVFRRLAIRRLFAINRRVGALWALLEEPMASHVVGRSRDVAEAFFEDLIVRRLGPVPNQAAMRSLSEQDGIIGDPKSRTAAPPLSSSPGGNLPRVTDPPRAGGRGS